MVEAAEVQNAVHDHLDHVVRALGTHEHVAELPRPDRAVLVDSEREHVGRRVDPAVLAVQVPDLALGDHRDGDVAIVDARGVERRLGGRAERSVAGDLDLDSYDRCSRDEYSSYAATIRCTSL